MRVWVILGCLTVAILGPAIIVDMNTKISAVLTAR
jgi:hypothetical protein